MLYAIIVTAVDCSELRDPAGGSVTLTASTTFESTAAYTCNDGFILIGNLRRTCQANGQWSGSEPACTSGMNSFDSMMQLLYRFVCNTNSRRSMPEA